MRAYLALFLAVAACGGSNPGDLPDGGLPDAQGVDVTPPECTSPNDCQGQFGPPPCGMWECTGGLCQVSCPGCTDGDGDGYGVEAAPGDCAGPDCDDADDTIFDSAQRTCYSGPPGTEMVGTCRMGVESCTAGAWTGCAGEVTPSGEACNGQDDDCNGMDDDGLGTFSCGLGACAAMVTACAGGVLGVCTPGVPAANDVSCDGVDDDCDGAIDENCPNCVKVATTGDDATAAATNNSIPFLTIQAAINWAAADATRARVVCVANGATCASGAATYSGAVVMASGISVYGGYESTLFTRCGISNLTTLQPGVAEGVMFPAAVTLPTALDGFRINRATTTTTAGVTVDGATNVILSTLTIDNTPSVTNSYAINMINGAQATITGSVIYAGAGTGESIGVRSVASTPTITNNCQSLDAFGHCIDFCGATNRAIRGRFTPGTGLTWAILLDNSPGALVESTAVCGIDADTGAGIRIVGDATGTIVRTSLINAWGGALDSHGIWLEDCGGAAPWIVDNEYIAAAGDSSVTRVDGIRSIGDCHPVIDTNEHITGGGEGGATGANGVYCGANSAGTASQCVVLGNLNIQGSDFGFPPYAVGVRCDDDGCLRIAGNFINGRGGVDVWGIYLGRSSTVIEDNEIIGGCGAMSSTGVYANDSFARLENNRIRAGACNTGAAGGSVFTGLHVVVAAGVNEIDVHSNVISGEGQPTPCTSTGLLLEAGPAGPSGGSGVYRNNIIRSGACTNKVVVIEQSTVSDPRIFENNDLDPTGAPPSIYMDEVGNGLTMAAQVNALTDMIVAGTISADPMFIAYPMDLHISATSPCDGAGTPAGAPAVDMDGDTRSSTTPDIGADER